MSTSPRERTAPPAIGRTPAAAVIAECLRVQASVAPRSALSRVLGRSPLGAAAEPWYSGALGELAVARRLEGLGAEWTVVHALPVGARGSDIDHLVIGPPGVFTVNAKFHEGATVWVGRRRLLVNGQKTEHLRNSRFEASRVAKMLASLGQVPVAPILAIVAARRITIREQPGDVAVLSDARLVRWLQRRPAVLSPAQCQAVCAALATLAPREDVDPGDATRFDRLRQEIRGARRVRTLWGAGILVAMVAASLNALAPQLQTFFS